MRQTKRKRSTNASGIGGAHEEIKNTTKVLYHDLDVPIPRIHSNPSLQKTRSLLQRLSSTGYHTVAFSHSIHGLAGGGGGGNNVTDLHADHTLSLLSSLEGITNDTINISKANNNCHNIIPKNKVNVKNNIKNNNKIRILKRLNIILEQVSDLQAYTIPHGNRVSALSSYDLVAISPRNDAAFASLCNTNTTITTTTTTKHNNIPYDILTLDYTAGRGGTQLPFQLSTSLLKSCCCSGNIVLELPYGPAIVDVSKRSAFVTVGRQVLMACVGIVPFPKIIVSSGGRRINDNSNNIKKTDAGSMALRSPEDLIHLCHVLWGTFHMGLKNASVLLCANAEYVVMQGQERKRNTMLLNLGSETMKEEEEAKKKKKQIHANGTSWKNSISMSLENSNEDDKEEEVEKNEKSSTIPIIGNMESTLNSWTLNSYKQRNRIKLSSSSSDAFPNTKPKLSDHFEVKKQIVRHAFDNDNSENTGDDDGFLRL